MRDFGQDIPVWGEFFLYNTTFSALTANSPNGYTQNEIRIDSDADFSFIKTMYFPTNDNPDIYVKYKDDSSGRYLMKNGINLRTVGGRSLALDNSGSFDHRAYIWPTPYNQRRASTFTVEAANSHPVLAPDVYLSFHGAKMRPGIAPWKRPGTRMPYTYALQKNLATLPDGVVRIAANQTISVGVSVDKDADFVCKAIMGSADGSCLVTIQEMGRDRQWMNTATHIRNVIGSGAFPNILAAPRFVPRGSVINFSIQDISGAQNDVEINMSGLKLFGGK